MKKGFFFVLSVTLLASFSLATAGMVTRDYVFDQPVITWVTDGQWISMNGCRTGGIPGTPALPSYGVRLLVPPGEGVASVRIVPGERYLLGADFVIPPNQYQVPYSFTGTYEEVPPSPDIYQSDRPYPYQFYSTPITQGYCGHTIAFFTLNPVSYNPVTGEVWWYSQMRVEVTTAPEANAAARFQTLYYRNDRIQKDLERWVDNPEEIGVYPPVQQTRQEEYDMVIITNAAMRPTFQTYADLKTRRGIRTFVQTTEWIYANVAGSDNQAKIRNYISSCYTNYHIQYVLLGGDGDASGAGRIIPHRGVYAASHYGGGDYTDTNLPCDLYYGGLDGTWNTDGDGQYGEETPEEADFIAEVHVGRACVDNVTEANRFINKHTMYQRSPVAADCDGDGILFAGELLWDDGGGWTFGDTYMQEVRWGSSAHGYTTEGVDEPAMADTLYDKAFYPGSWSALTHLKPKLNSGCSFLHHLGHANETYVCRFNSSDITDANLTNNGITHNFYIVYSQGCYCGSFEYNDCIAERWTVEINNGAVAIIMNSRYGWGYHMSTRGSSQYFHREFGDAIYGEHITHLAAANDDSKIDCLPWIENDDMANRWVALELNVFGDPELDMWTDVPQTLSPDYDPVYVIGVGTFEVNVPGVAGALVACNFGGQLVGRGYTDASGHVTITLNPAPIEPGTMEVVITAHNYLEHSGFVTVILPEGAYLLYQSLTINDSNGNDNGLVDFAEDVKLSVTLENVGMQAGSGVLVSISTADPYVTVYDDTADYGTIPAETTKTVADGFGMDVSASVPDLHPIPFALSATDGDSVWTDDFSITAHAPNLSIDHVMTLDGVNGRLDPGETTDLQVTLRNAGSAGLTNIHATLTCSDVYITLNTNTDDLASLGPNATGAVVFNVTASSDVPIGHLAEFQLALTAANYDFSDNFVTAIGLCVEDFESGGFAFYPWENDGNAPWTITTSGIYEGSRCAKSGTITHLQYSEMLVNLDVHANSPISFYYKISSESNNDYLRFYIDHSMMGQWSGQADWTQASFNVTTGNHTFTWVYTKDQYNSSGSDCAWLDYIVFPPVTTPELPPLAVCYDFESGTQGWRAGAADDDAIRGTWGRMDPEGTAYVGNPIQPEDDHTSAPGVYCFVTDGRRGAGAGSWDVDGGKTTLISPTWDLSGYQHALIDLRTWYSNDEGPAPGSDYFVVDVSSDGGASWVNLMTTTDDWEFWRTDRYALEDHITLTNQVQLRIVASDEGDDSFIEAAVDDVCLYGAIPQPPEAVTDVTAVVSGTDIVLSWTATSGADSYKVYRVADPFAAPTPGDLIGTTDGTTYTDAGVLATTETAFYIIVAANSQ